MITLYKGDDTAGQLGKKCIIKFHCDDVVDMSNVTVRFNLLGIVTKEFTNVLDGDELEVFVSHIDSRKLPLGIVYGKLWGEDSSGKLRTFANRIPFKLTTDLRCVYGSDGMDSVDVHVYASVDWDAVANKPTLFPSKVSMVEGLEEALKQAGKVKTVNGQSPDENGNIEIEIPSAKVDSVNGKTGDVELTAQDIPYVGEGASDVETAIEQNAQAIGENADAIDSLEQQVGELHTNTYSKSEVDDKINQSAAHYLTKRAGTVGHYTYPQFATHADLAAAKAAHTKENPQFFYGDEDHTPDKNDYCIVLADETHSGATTRYMFVGSWNDNGYFRYQYTINETALTDEQWDAVNSGITAAILAQLARKSDIPITTADIEDYENYRGHFDFAALYMKGDIVRAVKASTGEVVYFKSLADNNRGVNPFTEGQDRWERTEDDEGLDKLSKFVKAAIAGMTGADIPVSPTNTDKIDVALGKKLDKTDVTAPASDTDFSSDKNKDKVPTCGSVGAALLRRVATVDWSKITAKNITDFVKENFPELKFVENQAINSISAGIIFKCEGHYYKSKKYIPVGLSSRDFWNSGNYHEHLEAGLENLFTLFGLRNGALKETIAANPSGGLTDSAKAALFTDTAFSAACAYKLNDADANGVKDRAINKTTASEVTIPADFTDLILKVSGAVTKLTMTGITTAYGDDLPTEGNNLITVTRIAEDAVFVKVVALEDNSYAGA